MKSLEDAIVSKVLAKVRDRQARSNPPPTPDDEKFAQDLYDALAVNDDVNSWHKDALLPMIAKIAYTFAASQRQAERERIRGELDAMQPVLTGLPTPWAEGFWAAKHFALKITDGGQSNV